MWKETIRVQVILPWKQGEIQTAEEELRQSVIQELSARKPINRHTKIHLLGKEVLVTLSSVPGEHDEYDIHFHWTDLLLPDEQPPAQLWNSGGNNMLNRKNMLSGQVALSADDQKIFSDFWILPSSGWSDYWGRIILSPELKDQILNYLVLMKSVTGANLQGIGTALHHTILLYGPPGTGKTSLAKGIAYQLAEMFGRQTFTIYMEVNAHQLSSKWLSEGPKNVQKAFQHIAEKAQGGHPAVLVMDEVESLITQRGMSVNDANPVDVFRAVNAAIQEMDSLVRKGNILVIATSNILKAVDEAFLDRVDLALFLDRPKGFAREQILFDTIQEYQRKFSMNRLAKEWQNQEERDVLINLTEGWSGRQLRKLVFQALTSRREIAEQPSQLRLADLISSAKGFHPPEARIQHDPKQNSFVIKPPKE